MAFEKPVPPGSGAKKFEAEQTDARAGLPEHAAEAQKKAAEKAIERRGEEVDLTEELKKAGADNAAELARIAEEIKGTPGGALEEVPEPE